MPLNSYADDFAYAEQGNIIYMSSNRNNKPGLDEIYLVKKLELPPDTIKGVIFDNLTEKPITEATLIVLIDSISGDTIAKSYTNENGEYELIINKKREEDDESRMFAVIKKEGYEDEAIEFYTKGLEIKPEDYKFYSNRGKQYFLIDQPAKAVSDLLKAIELNPGAAWYLEYLGKSYINLGKFKEAQLHIEKAIELDPSYAEDLKDLLNNLKKLTSN